jgi:hypothetical protein
MVQYVNSRVVAASALSTEPSEHMLSLRAEQQRRPAFKRFRSVTLRNNVFPAAVAIQLTFIVVLLISHMKGSKTGLNQSQLFGNDAPWNAQVSKRSQPDIAFVDEPRPFLPEPLECNEWRGVSTDKSKLRVYYKHFTSLDKSMCLNLEDDDIGRIFRAGLGFLLDIEYIVAAMLKFMNWFTNWPLNRYHT